MQIKELKIPGSFLIQCEPKTDERGFFMRVYDQELFENHGIHREWLQENHAKTLRNNTLRGLHLQMPPHAESKLVRCLNGTILDVFVDVREGSPTFGQWEAIKLSAEEKNMVFVPEGCAHGYMSLEEEVEVSYKVDATYHPECEQAIYWNDPDLAIDWGVKYPLVSEKDQHASSFKEFVTSTQPLRV